VGDYVDIKANASIQKGMPFKGFHGRTGVVFNVTKRALGVTVNKVVSTFTQYQQHTKQPNNPGSKAQS